MVYLVEGGAEELGTQPSVWPLTPHSIWGALRGVDHHSLQPQESCEIAAVPEKVRQQHAAQRCWSRTGQKVSLRLTLRTSTSSPIAKSGSAYTSPELSKAAASSPLELLPGEERRRGLLRGMAPSTNTHKGA